MAKQIVDDAPNPPEEDPWGTGPTADEIDAGITRGVDGKDGEPEPGPTKAEPGEKPKGEGEPGAEPTYEVDGKRYTLQEMRELRDSGLKGKDYTQKTQKLAEERRALDEERAQVRQQLAAAGVRAPGAPAEGKDQKTFADEARAAGFDENDFTFKLAQRMDNLQEDIVSREHDNLLRQTADRFETRFDALCTREKVPEELRVRLYNLVGLHPETTLENMEERFMGEVRYFQGFRRAGRRDLIDETKGLPAVGAPKSGTKRVEKPDVKKEDQDDWDDQVVAREFQENLGRRLGS